MCAEGEDLPAADQGTSLLYPPRGFRAGVVWVIEMAVNRIGYASGSEPHCVGGRRNWGIPAGA